MENINLNHYILSRYTDRESEGIADCLIALVELPADDTVQKAEIYAILGQLYSMQGKLNESIRAFLHCLEAVPSNDNYLESFLITIKYAEFTLPHPQIREILIDGFSRLVNRQNITIPGLSLLKLTPGYLTFEPTILEDPLLLGLLENTIVPDSKFESWMTQARLMSLTDQVELPEKFLVALVMQNFLNEYCYTVSKHEKQLIKKIQSLDQISKKQLLTLACYSPISKLSSFKAVNDSICFGKIFRQQIDEPLREKEIAKNLISLKPTTNNTSKKVAAQYEENPYPRWLTPSNPSKKRLEEVINALFPFINYPELNYKPKILIAGCGTGQHAINTALEIPYSDILAIDLSRHSLSYAMRKAEEFNVVNIRFLQADILDLESVNETFDLIECAGVLHHLQDPQEGLRILTSLLAPHGMMFVSLYSKIARSDVVEARKLIESEYGKYSLDSMRQSRQALLQLKQFIPLTSSIDFYSSSACRDLLFHVQEHQFSLLQIEQILKCFNLELVGMEIRNPDLLKEYKRLYPEDPKRISLKNWDAFEKIYPQTFLGMYPLWITHKIP